MQEHLATISYIFESGFRSSSLLVVSLASATYIALQIAILCIIMAYEIFDVVMLHNLLVSFADSKE